MVFVSAATAPFEAVYPAVSVLDLLGDASQGQLTKACHADIRNHRGEVHYPTTNATRVKLLFLELAHSILASKKNATGIDPQMCVEGVLINFIDRLRVVCFRADTRVVNQASVYQHYHHQKKIVIVLTCPTCHTLRLSWQSEQSSLPPC
jgi:hypothetical protein